MSVNLNLELFGVCRARTQKATHSAAESGGLWEGLRRVAAGRGPSAAVSASIFFGAALLIQTLRRDFPGSDPQAGLMLAPVLAISVRHGRAAATAAWLASLVISWFALLSHPAHSLQFVSPNDFISFTTLAVAGPILARVGDRWRAARRDLEMSEERRQSFQREVLLAVTGGRLYLSDPAALGARVPGAPTVQYPLRCLDDIGLVRSRVRVALETRGSSCDRIDDLLMCVTEAATNSLKHAGGGALSLWISDARVFALIADHGEGISPVNLARATLEAGFSTQDTLGMGFTLMLAMCDSLTLATSPAGTQVLIEIGVPQPRAREEQAA